MSKLLEQINKEKTLLGSVVEVTSSKRIYLSEYKTQGIPFFRSKEIIEAFKGAPISSELFISDDRYNEVKNKFGVPQKGDILLTSIGTIGIPFRVTNDKPFYFKDGNLTWFKNYIGIDSLYLYYWITSIKGQSQIESNSIGSSQSALTIDSIKKMEIDLPDLPTQKKIAEILSAYDAKIENNNKIIKNLETTAQTIFNEWFVSFRFPGHEKAKFVESEMGEIPEGWEAGKVKNLVRVESGFPFSSSIFDNSGKYKLVTIRNVQDGSFVTDCENHVDVLPDKLPAHCRLHSGDILLSLTGNVGRVCLVNGEDYVLNQRVSVLVPVNERDRAYAYFLFRKKDFQNLLISISKGTAQLNLSPVETRDLEAIVPSEEVLERYGRIAMPMYEKIVEINSENQRLRESRDQLLAELI